MSPCPRPWRVRVRRSGFLVEAMVVSADNYGVTGWIQQIDAELIVRHVNAGPGAVEALEAAEIHLKNGASIYGTLKETLGKVRVALEKLRP